MVVSVPLVVQQTRLCEGAPNVLQTLEIRRRAGLASRRHLRAESYNLSQTALSIYLSTHTHICLRNRELPTLISEEMLSVL